jgi:GxxExxY protein
MPLEISPTVTRIIGCAIDVHKALGPGLTESPYDRCLAHKLTRENIPFRRQVPVPIEYDGCRLDCGFRIDLLVAEEVVVELKSVERLLPIHKAQTLTYLKLSGLRFGLLINFNVPMLIDGVESLFNANGVRLMSDRKLLTSI